MANQRKSGSAAQNKRTKIIVTAVVIAVALLITFAPYMNLPFDIPTWGELLSGNEQTIQSGDALNQPFTVHVIDVGQGDSILVKSGDHAMLIDAGERGNDQAILDYLKANSVEKLDYIVATHPIPTISAVCPRLLRDRGRQCYYAEASEVHGSHDLDLSKADKSGQGLRRQGDIRQDGRYLYPRRCKDNYSRTRRHA